MRTIYKYPLETTDEQIIPIPSLSSNESKDIAVSFKNQILKIDTQHGRVFMWCLVDDDGIKTDRKIYVRGTGHNCNGLTKTDYIGTYQLYDGDLIFHIFCE